MTYETYDFTESMKGQSIELSDIKKVHAGWGNVNKDGSCCDECGGEWTGGFLIEMKDGRFGYISGWCDYTGWGCQDGTDIAWFDVKPELSTLSEIPSEKWDIEPADLNLVITKREV